MITASAQLISGSVSPGHLELPRPLPLLRTIAWSLTESAGFRPPRGRSPRGWADAMPGWPERAREPSRRTTSPRSPAAA